MTAVHQLPASLWMLTRRESETLLQCGAFRRLRLRGKFRLFINTVNTWNLNRRTTVLVGSGSSGARTDGASTEGQQQVNQRVLKLRKHAPPAGGGRCRLKLVRPVLGNARRCLLCRQSFLKVCPQSLRDVSGLLAASRILRTGAGHCSTRGRKLKSKRCDLAAVVGFDAIGHHPGDLAFQRHLHSVANRVVPEPAMPRCAAWNTIHQATTRFSAGKFNQPIVLKPESQCQFECAICQTGAR